MPMSSSMNSFLQRLLGGSPSRNIHFARLQLQLLVAMAVIDGRIDDSEYAQVEDFIERAAGSDREHRELHRLFARLVDDPPDLDDVLTEVARHAGKERVAQRMLDELVVVAEADYVLDHREGFLLDLVHDAFELPRAEAVDVDVDLAQLHDLVRRSAAGRRAA